ncbi:MAG: hypothetical protein AABY32_03760 [Nanoarchaeota archaeon]
MKNRKVDSKWRYFYAFVSAICLFLIGFYIVFLINYIEFNKASVLQEKGFYDFYSNQLNYSFFGEMKCDKQFLDKISSSMDFQGFLINQLELKKGKENKEVIDKKKYYYLLELSHLSFVKQLNQDCNWGYNFILFLYSNSMGDRAKSEEIGRILDYVKEKDSNVLIYSFDSSSQDSIVQNLKSFYNITEPITIIINENYSLNSVKDANQILSLLK